MLPRVMRLGWANRANRADPPLSDPAPMRQMTFQVTYTGIFRAHGVKMG